MLEIDKEKYGKYACEYASFYYGGKHYDVFFPVDPEEHYGFWDYTAYSTLFYKKLYVSITAYDHENYERLGAEEEVKEYFYTNLDSIIENSATRIHISYGLTKNISYYVDSTGIHRLGVGNLDRMLLWGSVDKSYEERYMALRRKYLVKGEHFYFLYGRFLKEITENGQVYTFDEALALFEKDPSKFESIHYLADYDPSDPIISIYRPSITRRTGNKNTKTFDFVNVEILLRSDLQFTDFDEFIRDNLSSFNERILKSIDEDNRYKKYGVPSRYLNLYSIAKQGRTGLRFSYELRNIFDFQE